MARVAASRWRLRRLWGGNDRQRRKGGWVARRLLPVCGRGVGPGAALPPSRMRAREQPAPARHGAGGELLLPRCGADRQSRSARDAHRRGRASTRRHRRSRRHRTAASRLARNPAAAAAAEDGSASGGPAAEPEPATRPAASAAPVPESAAQPAPMPFRQQEKRGPVSGLWFLLLTKRPVRRPAPFGSAARHAVCGTPAPGTAACSSPGSCRHRTAGSTRRTRHTASRRPGSVASLASCRRPYRARPRANAAVPDDEHDQEHEHDPPYTSGTFDPAPSPGPAQGSVRASNLLPTEAPALPPDRARPPSPRTSPTAAVRHRLHVRRRRPGARTGQAAGRSGSSAAVGSGACPCPQSLTQPHSAQA